MYESPKKKNKKKKIVVILPIQEICYMLSIMKLKGKKSPLYSVSQKKETQI